MIWRQAALVACVCLSSAAFGADKKTEIAGQGVGTMSCAQFAKMYQLDSEQAESDFYQWALGFLTGWNSAQIDLKRPFRDINSMDIEDQKRLLRTYCDQHPLGDFMDAIWHLMGQLKETPSPGAKSD